MYILNILLILSFCCATLADNACIFEHPTKGVIDLTSIGLRNNQPRFRDVSSSLSAYYTYSFNPCYPFMENGCQNASVCQISSDRSYSFILGKQNLATWTLESENTPVLTYTHGLKTVAISMMCTPNLQDEFEVLGENPVNYYSMRLRSRCACWNECKTPVTSTTTAPPVTSHVIYYSACMYHDSRYGSIDLSSIGSMTGIPAFKDVPSKHPNNFVWSYNPCYKFSELHCQNVSGCQVDKIRNVSYTIGLHEKFSWINMNGLDNPIRSIVYQSNSVNRRLTVQLICDQTLTYHRLDVAGETALGEYTMQLTSPCACWNGCVGPTPDPEPFDWTIWIIAGGVSGVVFIIFCVMISCLFCSKPKRPRYPVMIVDEKTPFMKDAINYKA